MSKEEIYEILYEMRLAPRHQLEIAAIKIEHAIVTQAAANKAAEEGGLPAPDTHCYDEDTQADVWSYSKGLVQKILAADRASRQVANKAEVDLSSLPIAWYVKEVHPGWPEFNRIDEFSGGLTDGDKLVRLADVEALLATPPATTGASTVLTDERIDAVMVKYSTCVAPGVYSLNGFDCVEDMRSFAREVAAQAGQVAVPEDLTRDAARYRWMRSFAYQAFELVFHDDGALKYGKELDEAIDSTFVYAAPSPAKESK